MLQACAVFVLFCACRMSENFCHSRSSLDFLLFHPSTHSVFCILPGLWHGNSEEGNGKKCTHMQLVSSPYWISLMYGCGLLKIVHIFIVVLVAWIFLPDADVCIGALGKDNTLMQHHCFFTHFTLSFHNFNFLDLVCAGNLGSKTCLLFTCCRLPYINSVGTKQQTTFEPL